MEFIIKIEVLENGFEVTVPDVAKMKAKEKQAKADKYPSPYMGDCTKEYVAKTSGEVMKFVKEALAQIPEIEYADAFAAASKEMKGMKG